jgi:hypothetical protein
MSEMVEKVAKAIKAEDFQSENLLTNTDCQRLARAAIAAMREPTEKMVEAVYAAAEGLGCVMYETPSPEQAWPTMIDAALE